MTSRHTRVGQSEEKESSRVAVPPCFSHNVGVLLNRAARIIKERMAEAIQPLGLSLQELGVLRLISDQGPLSQQDLCHLYNVDRTTVMHLIDDLEKRELVIRTTNSKDRRSNLLFLTPRGKRLFGRARKIAAREQDSFLAPLNENERDVVRVGLIKLIEHACKTAP